MKRSDLIGIEVVINNVDEAKQFSRLCSDYGIYQGDWSCCNYTNGTMRGLVSLDKGTDYSCKLVFTTHVEDEDTTIEFCNLRKVDLHSLLKPEQQFQNGDTVYDEDGNEYVYVAPVPGIKGNSVVVGEFRYFDMPTTDLTHEKPVTPKDGEWWMCELTDENLEITQIFNNVLRFSSDWEITGYPKNKIKPLYRMIRDTNTDTE
ncbi:hypothetical protein VP142E351_P0055 [Vibrio phage 142E35-1]|nr:hypothetical protein VP142E351_P0055 [Vibrio phage 142E35-1]